MRGFDAYLRDHLYVGTIMYSSVEVLRHRQKSIYINGIGTPVKLIVRCWTVAGSSSFPSQSIPQCIELLFEPPFSHSYFLRGHASLFMALPPTSDQPSHPFVVVLLPHPTGSGAPLLVPPSLPRLFAAASLIWHSVTNGMQCAVQSETLNGT